MQICTLRDKVSKNRNIYEFFCTKFLLKHTYGFSSLRYIGGNKRFGKWRFYCSILLFKFIFKKVKKGIFFLLQIEQKPQNMNYFKKITHLWIDHPKVSVRHSRDSRHSERKILWLAYWRQKSRTNCILLEWATLE